MSERLEVAIRARLADFTLDVAWTAGDGVSVLFGPSGAGKTLTLQCLAGLVRPDAGRIVVDGRVLFDGAAVQEILQTSDASPAGCARRHAVRPARRGSHRP